VTPIGIPLGAGVIVGSWVLTAIYIVWANQRYDPEAKRLLDTIGLHEPGARRPPGS
jgi:uncharacterized membrane protein (DUF485 family)